MVRGLRVLLADAVMIGAILFVMSDVNARTAEAVARGLSPSYSYSVLTQYFSVVREATVLQSPPTLDWIQLLSLAFVAVNSWFAYGLFRGRKAAAA